MGMRDRLISKNRIGDVLLREPVKVVGSVIYNSPGMKLLSFLTVARRTVVNRNFLL